jgi:acetolactate synthase-1/2/3 large subunit
VRRIQSTVFKREIGTALHNPDFVALARALGLPATAVDSPAGLEAALQAALAAGEPGFIVVRVGPMPGPWHLVHTFSKAPQPAPPNPLGEPAS